MRMKVEQLPGEPIIIARVQGGADPDGATNLYKQVADLADRSSGPVFTIYDIRKFKTYGWGQTLGVLRRAASKTPGSPSDPRIRTVLVGSTERAKTSADALQGDLWGKLNIRFFEDLDTALAYIREEIANGK